MPCPSRLYAEFGFVSHERHTDAKTGADELPSGMALSPDGSRLYVALNGANALGVIDTASNALVARIPVGNAPRQVVLAGNRAYVSNEGGRPAKPGDLHAAEHRAHDRGDPRHRAE